jgi:hypothetical protein
MKNKALVSGRKIAAVFGVADPHQCRSKTQKTAKNSPKMVAPKLCDSLRVIKGLSGISGKAG